ncbi:MAG TPA: TIGR04282 family arsenosugar biosynthesis glycosyltransferase [Nocardioides sp.]|uniref:TIGR04282 family arsenosugar biosynthesis glycosyltransferase n=1 Tax=Nocardioides sp. TaxID=35761 RepID=UPI002E300686|nr:TIGR04282 family arsenosugar biosynthesis glycosyltransferase [Nocardioides sp.]HEX5087605.1 TIGR04282 family arsenosugar biosynthesis glycosyltransferase [Nocardioides sp.]
MSPSLLVMAKAPEPGLVKTRLGAVVGMEQAAVLAAASLHDTLATGVGTGWPRHVALDGDLARAEGGPSLRRALSGWTVHPQQGTGLAERLARAHARVPGPVVQVGMDTPQIRPSLLHEVAAGLSSYDAVLGPAEDGGWWVLALREPRCATALVGVPMSTPTTGDETVRALEAIGLSVGEAPRLRDVDTVDDAEVVARLSPRSRFAAAWTILREAS